MAGNISINNTFQGKAKPIIDNFRVVKGFTGKTSITALSKDLIMQFPVIMSAGVDIDDAVSIAKGLEKMFATMFLTVWTADASLKISEYGMNGVRDFVKKYHNNDDIPDVIQYGGDILSLTDTLLGTKEGFAVEDFDANLISDTTELPALEGAKLWESMESRLSLESLNDMYLPIKKTQKQIGEITEALEKTHSTAEPARRGTAYSNIQQTVYKMQNDSIDPYSGKPGSGYGSKTNVGYGGKSINSASIVKNSEKLGNMVPTLIDVTFLVRGPGAGGVTRSTNDNGEVENRTVDVREQRAIVGVKTMVRLVSSEYMIPNVIASIQDQSLAFKFVKWTKGEMKVGRDMILGISRMKQDATATGQADMWFAALRKRKRAAKTFKFSNTGINPFATLVLTSEEVEQIKQTSGYDVTDAATAKLLMDNLFLLGFVIVNKSTGIVNTLFDGSESFSTTTLKNLKLQSGKDSMGVNELRELRMLMGKM